MRRTRSRKYTDTVKLHNQPKYKQDKKEEQNWISASADITNRLKLCQLTLRDAAADDDDDEGLVTPE